MSTLSLGHPRTASGRVARWLAVGGLVVAQVAALAFALLPVPARADFVPRVLAEGRLTIVGSGSVDPKMYDTYDWTGYQPGVNGQANVSDVHNPGSPVGGLCAGAPYGCPYGRVLAEVDEGAGTLRVHATTLAGVGVPETIGDRSLASIGSAYAVIEDAITLSAPATVTLRGHLAGSVGHFGGNIFFQDPEPDQEFNGGAVFWREDTSNPEGGRIYYGGYGAYLYEPGTIDEDFSVQVSLLEGTTYFTASMDAWAYALSSAERFGLSANDFEYYDQYASVSFDNTFGFEIVVPAGVVATSASGLLPLEQGSTSVVPAPPALFLLLSGLIPVLSSFVRKKERVA